MKAITTRGLKVLPLFYPLNSKIGIRILHTVLYTLPMIL